MLQIIPENTIDQFNRRSHAASIHQYIHTNLTNDINQSLKLNSNEIDIDNSNNIVPEIISRTKDTAIQMGQTVILSCHIRHHNGAKAIWRKTEPDCMIISNTTAKYQCSMTAMGEARLQINKTDPHDSGVYVCAVSNPFGIVQCAIGLTVLNVSKSDDSNYCLDIYVEIVNTTSVRVSWDFSASTTNSYIIEYCRFGNNNWMVNDDKPVRSRYILTGLTPGETYTFRLRCPNTNTASLSSAPISMPLSEQHMWQQQQFNNRYSSVSELGRGRFAIIRLATDAVTGHKVALKQISRKYQDLISTQEEYKLLASSQHPNIIRALALFENAPLQGVDTIVMEM